MQLDERTRVRFELLAYQLVNEGEIHTSERFHPLAPGLLEFVAGDAAIVACRNGAEIVLLSVLRPRPKHYPDEVMEHAVVISLEDIGGHV